MPHFKLLCTVSWDYQHCTWIKKEPGWNTLLTFKISNGNGAHQKPCQKNYLLFPNISLPFTSLPVNCKHSPFQASSLPNDEVRRSESRSWLINLLSCLWTPHFSLPVNCKLQLGLLCTVSWDCQHCTWIKKSLGGTRCLPSKWGTETEHIKILVKRLICCFLTSHFPWPLYL